jgi:hypothetical protein
MRATTTVATVAHRWFGPGFAEEPASALVRRDAAM